MTPPLSGASVRRLIAPQGAAMIEVVTSRNALLYREALDEMFRLRHRIFVESRGYERLRRPDGLQKDRFDIEDAIYLLLTEDDGTVRGTQRLLPTTGPHVFADAMPELCSVKGVQRGERILELSRACVDETALDRPMMEEAHKRMVVGLFEFCRRAGFEKFTMLLPTEMLFHHLVIGVDIKPLGLPVERNGMSQLAAVVPANQHALDAMRLALDVHEPLVHYVGGPLADSLVLSPQATPMVAA
jgi:acyl-homoserine lactone synthase